MELKFSKKNKKLIPNDKIEFAIFSLPAEITCPYSTPLCRKYCYAKKAEIMYPNVRLSRENNYKAVTSGFFVQLAKMYFDKRLASKSHIGKKLIVRIHESGDFFSRSNVADWLEITRYYKHRDDIVFMAYTKSIRYFDYNPITDGLLLRFSLWADSSLEDIKRAGLLNIPIYSACNGGMFKAMSEANKCHCEDCGTCLKCYDILSPAWLYCQIH